MNQVDTHAQPSSPARQPWQAAQIHIHGDRIYIGNVLPVTAQGEFLASKNIGAQTEAVFQRLRDALVLAGCGLADLVRINTYYVYNGPEDGATRYWEEMTAVRLKYFEDPGPVGTAVRVAGTARHGMLIQLEAEALLPSQRSSRRRIMPTDSWDWSVPVPLSQGWRQGDHLWVGGQVCADRQGRAVSLGDLATQTATVLRYIRNVLHDGDACDDDLLHLKICYLHDGDEAESARRLNDILLLCKRTFGDARPATTAFGVNLLYEGLLLEIDASAVVGGAHREQTTQASRRGRFIQVSAQGAGAAEDPLSLQVLQASLGRCLREVESLGGQPADVCRLTVFIAAPAWLTANIDDAADVQRTLRSAWSGGRAPAITVSVVAGLPGDTMLQIDCLACLTDCNGSELT